MVFRCAVLLVDKSTSPFRTSISYQLLLCFAQLQNQRIKTFQPMFLHISGSYLSPHEFQYLFLIPTDTELQLLLSDMPAWGAWTVEQWFLKKTPSPILGLEFKLGTSNSRTFPGRQLVEICAPRKLNIFLGPANNIYTQTTE